MAPVPVPAGSLIIPMDTTYQNQGMFEAYGLVYDLLKKGIPVIWSIEPGKPYGGTDFTASGTDFQTGAPVTGHPYRGGPFIIHQTYASSAEPIITAWQSSHTTTVHRVTSDFMAPEYALLTSAPRIAVGIASAGAIGGYLNAAGISDWTVLGPNRLDDELFENPGETCKRRAYDIFLAPQSSSAPAVENAFREWVRLGGYVHGVCFPIGVTENRFHFLTTTGILPPLNQGDPGTFTVDEPYFGLDQAVPRTGLQTRPGGTEQTWSRSAAGYRPHTRTMAHFHNSSGDQFDLMILGPYEDGTGAGTISYQGGCNYSTDRPYLTNPQAPFLRFLYNALLLCVALPQIEVTLSPSTVAVGLPTPVTVTVRNMGGQPALNLSVAITLLPGVAWADNETLPPVSAGPPTWTWVIPVANPGVLFSFRVTVTATAPGETPLLTFDATYAAPDGTPYQLRNCAAVGARHETPPIVTITSPLAGDLICGDTTITWTASDADGDSLTYDLFYSADGVTYIPLAMGISDTSLFWDTGSLTGTLFHVRVIASDGILTGQDDQGPFSVDNTPPTAAITAPPDGSTVSGTVTVHGTAGDSIGLDYVQWRIDGVLVATQIAGPFAYGWDTTAYANGPHIVTLTAVDTCGYTATATARYVVRNGSNCVHIESGVDADFIIPPQKPPAETLRNVVYQIKITRAVVIGTPLGSKVIVTGIVHVLIIYVATLREQPVHAVEQDFPFEAFLLWPGAVPDIPVDITVMARSLTFHLVGPHTISGYIVLDLDVCSL